MKKLLLSGFILTFIISISAVSAAGNVLVIVPKVVTVYTGQTQAVDVVVQNNESSTDTFTLSIFPPQFEKVSTNLNSFLVTLAPNAQQTIKLYFTAAIDAEPVSRSFALTAKSTTDSTISDTESIRLDVTRSSPVYVRDITLDNYNVNPGDQVNITVDVFNLQDTPSGNYSAKITAGKGDGIIQTWSEAINFITPKTSLKFSEALNLNKYSLPGTYSVTAELRDQSNQLVYSKSINFNVKTVTQPPTEYTQRSSSYNILFTTVTIQTKNEGNVGLPSFTVTESLPGFMGVLFDPAIEPTSVSSDGGRVVYSWNVQALAPGGQYTVSYNIALWRIWVALGIIVGIGYLMYKWFSTPVVTKGMRQEGKITRGKEVTVLIEVKNKALHEIKDVEVIDVVPPIAKVVERFETLRPKLGKAPHGTLVKFLVGSMKPREERVLTYKIKSLVDVSGPLNLPPAEILYTDRGQNRRNIVSKQTFVKA